MAFLVAAARRADVRRMVQAVLTRAGHTVVLFQAGAPAIAEVAAGRPDVVLVAGPLADMDAVEVCRALRAQPSTAGVPIVICGALSASGPVPIRRAGERAPILRARLVPSELRAAVGAALASVRECHPLT